jgi:Conserved mid region of cactin
VILAVDILSSSILRKYFMLVLTYCECKLYDKHPTCIYSLFEFRLKGLTIQDLEDLIEDIKVYIELEQGKNVGYWRDITIITEEELNKLRKIDPNYQGRVQITGIY